MKLFAMIDFPPNDCVRKKSAQRYGKFRKMGRMRRCFHLGEVEKNEGSPKAPFPIKN